MFPVMSRTLELLVLNYLVLQCDATQPSELWLSDSVCCLSTKKLVFPDPRALWQMFSVKAQQLLLRLKLVQECFQKGYTALFVTIHLTDKLQYLFLLLDLWHKFIYIMLQVFVLCYKTVDLCSTSWATIVNKQPCKELQCGESWISSSKLVFFPLWQIAPRSTKWSLIVCSWGPTILSTLSPLLSIHPALPPSLLPPNTQHRGCAWVKHYNSSRKWPFLRNFRGAVKGRRLMSGRALWGTGTPPPTSTTTFLFPLSV